MKRFVRLRLETGIIHLKMIRNSIFLYGRNKREQMSFKFSTQGQKLKTRVKLQSPIHSTVEMQREDAFNGGLGLDVFQTLLQ